MHQKRRLAKSLQHKATLMEEKLRHNNAVIPDAQPAAQPPATQPPAIQPAQPNCAVCRLGIGDQQFAKIAAESSTPLALERSPSPASPLDWLPMDGRYPMPPPAPRKDQTPLSSSEWDLESFDS